MYLATNDNSTALKTYHDYYLNRLKVGFVTGIVGNNHLRSGIGKSYTAIRTGQLIDPDYLEGSNAMEKICFRPREFTEAMDYVEDKGKPGQVIILDEASLMINSKKWHDYVNRAIADSVVTFRKLRGLLICVCPHLGWLDKEVREYVSHRGECNKKLGPDGKTMVVQYKFHKLYWDEYKGKYYKNRIKMYVRNDHEGNKLDRIIEFKYWHVQNPEPFNPELVQEYEKQAGRYKKQVRKSIQKLDQVSKDVGQYVKDVLDDSEVRKMLVVPTPKGERVYEGDVKRYFKITHALSRDIARKINQELIYKQNIVKQRSAKVAQKQKKV